MMDNSEGLSALKKDILYFSCHPISTDMHRDAVLHIMSKNAHIENTSPFWDWLSIQVTP